MKKAPKGSKRVHPSSTTITTTPFSHISALPTALLTLATALSPQDQEVLAYLLSCQQHQQQQQQQPPKPAHSKHRRAPNNKARGAPAELSCSCFTCYKSFWARWDASPNRHVIHLILDAFENTNLYSKDSKDDAVLIREEMKKDKEVVAAADKVDDGHDADDGYGDDEYEEYDDDDDEVEDGEGKSTVRRFVSWVFGINN